MANVISGIFYNVFFFALWIDLLFPTKIQYAMQLWILQMIVSNGLHVMSKSGFPLQIIHNANQQAQQKIVKLIGKLMLEVNVTSFWILCVHLQRLIFDIF